MTYLTGQRQCKSKETRLCITYVEISQSILTPDPNLMDLSIIHTPLNIPEDRQRRQNTRSQSTFPRHPKRRYMVSANLSWHMHGATQSSPAHGHDATDFSARNSAEISGTGSYPVRTRFCLWFCASSSASTSSSSSNSPSSSCISSSTLTLRSWYRLAVARFWRAMSLPPGL